MNKRLRLRPIHVVPVLTALLLTLAYCCFRPLPWRIGGLHRAVVWAECRYCYALTAAGCDTVYFRAITDSLTMLRPSDDVADAVVTLDGQGFWYSPNALLPLCGGRVVVTENLLPPSLSGDNLLGRRQSPAMALLADTVRWPQFATDEAKRCRRLADNARACGRQLDYYMNTHSLTDEGFNQVADAGEEYRLRMARIMAVDSLLHVIDSVGQPVLSLIVSFACRCVGEDGTLLKEETPLALTYDTPAPGLRLLQAADNRTPDMARTICRPLFNCTGWLSSESRTRTMLVGFNNTKNAGFIGDSLVFCRVDGECVRHAGDSFFSTTIPLLDTSDGALVTDHCGMLLGVVYNQHIIPLP